MSENKIPKSIGFILDGNRRWAKENNLPKLEGHRRGMNKLKDVCEWAQEAGVKEVVAYAFSTENWNRSPEEVSYLMNLFEEMCVSWSIEMQKRNIKIRFIGQRARLSETLQEKMNSAEEETKEGTEGTLIVCISYGGRTEIVEAVNALLNAGVEKVDEKTFKQALWSADFLDPDLIIRTGGEKRLSNFLTWGGVYSELFFTDTKLPGFTREEFISILEEYAERDRRHGK